MRVGVVVPFFFVVELVDAGTEEEAFPVLPPDEKILLVLLDAEQWSATGNLEGFTLWVCVGAS